MCLVDKIVKYRIGSLHLELAECDEICDNLAETVSLDTSDSSDGVDKMDSHLIFLFKVEGLMKEIRVVLSKYQSYHRAPQDHNPSDLFTDFTKSLSNPTP